MKAGLWLVALVSLLSGPQVAFAARIQEIISVDTGGRVGLINFGSDQGSCTGNSLCLEDGITIVIEPNFQAGDIWSFNSRTAPNTTVISIDWEIDSFWNLILNDFTWSVVSSDVRLDFLLRNSDPATVACTNCEPLETYRFSSASVPEPTVITLLGLALAGLGLSKRRS